jgi:hypothetical protein
MSDEMRGTSQVAPFASEADLNAALEVYERNMGRICESREPDDFRVLDVELVHARLVATALLRLRAQPAPLSDSPEVP